MDTKVRDALKVLGFGNTSTLPKLKDIRKRYIKLSVLHHPDKNNGSKESHEMFLSILSAYEIAGKACEDIIYEDDDQDDLLARKMFKQFCFSSVKENTTTFTIKTEISLNTIWNEVLESNFGNPADLSAHGLKYTTKDTCSSVHSKIYITIYKKGKMLIQAEGNKHTLTSHFVNNHLEDLYTQVYNKKKLQRALAARTPLTKHTGRKAISRVHKCHKCDFQCSEVGAFYNHKKRMHGRNIPASISYREESASRGDNPAVNTDIEFDVQINNDCTSPPPSKFHCMMCGVGFAEEPELSLHEKNVHEIPCHQCNYTFHTQEEIKIHSVAAHPPPARDEESLHSCDVCEYTSTRLDILESHKSIHHPRCMECDIHFLSDNELSEHFTTKHSDNYGSLVPVQSSPEVPCILCGKTFLCPAVATEHLKTQHENHCHQCKNVFYDKSFLSLHMAVCNTASANFS